MKKLLIGILLVTLLTGCGEYQENPQTGKTEYHGTYSDDPGVDDAVESTLILMPVVVN